MEQNSFYNDSKSSFHLVRPFLRIPRLEGLNESTNFIIDDDELETENDSIFQHEKIKIKSIVTKEIENAFLEEDLNLISKKMLLQAVKNYEETGEQVKFIQKENGLIRFFEVIWLFVKLLGNNCDLNWLDVSNATDMSHTFSCLHFVGDISKWDVSNVKRMEKMFYNCDFNGDISNWDVSNVENMERMFAMSKFNGDISNWDVSNVENMDRMFYGAVFNQDISKWNVSDVSNFNMMFCRSRFNQDISDWNISNGIFMDQMFYNSAFSQDISKWEIHASTTNMMEGTPVKYRIKNYAKIEKEN